jgi:preprotein translocase SecE subunit
MNSVITFFKGVASEARKTTWLSPTEALGHTAIVVVLSVLIGYFLGLFDGIFSHALSILIANR